VEYWVFLFRRLAGKDGAAGWPARCRTTRTAPAGQCQPGPPHADRAHPMTVVRLKGGWGPQLLRRAEPPKPWRRPDRGAPTVTGVNRRRPGTSTRQPRPGPYPGRTTGENSTALLRRATVRPRRTQPLPGIGRPGQWTRNSHCPAQEGPSGPGRVTVAGASDLGSLSRLRVGETEPGGRDRTTLVMAAKVSCQEPSESVIGVSEALQRFCCLFRRPAGPDRRRRPAGRRRPAVGPYQSGPAPATAHDGSPRLLPRANQGKTLQHTPARHRSRADGRPPASRAFASVLHRSVGWFDV
jgi:hypothetical protein